MIGSRRAASWLDRVRTLACLLLIAGGALASHAGSLPAGNLNRDCSVSSFESLYSANLAVLADKSVWSWGDAWNALSSSTPVRLPDFQDARMVSISAVNSHVLLEDGTLWGWGYNTSGSIGDGTEVARMTPVRVAIPEPVASVFGGHYHAFAVTADGRVYAWGQNGSKQLGLPSTASWESTPTLVDGLSNIVQMAPGYEHSLALAADGTVYGFGNSQEGQVGNGSRMPPPGNLPITRVNGLPPVRAVAVGSRSSYAVTVDGEVWVWGAGLTGQLGLGASVLSAVTVTPIPGLTGVINVEANHFTAMALQADGGVMAWGNGRYGAACALGLPWTTPVWSPAPAAFAGPVQWVSGGHSHMVALLADGTLWACGENTNGEVGDGTVVLRTSPTRTLLDPDAVPGDQGNVLRAVRSGADVRLEFAGAAAYSWRVFRDDDVGMLGVTPLTPDPATKEFIDRGVVGVAGTGYYRVRGLSYCSLTLGP